MLSSDEIFQGKILVVDDQKANVLLLENMLREAGYRAVTSTTVPGEVCELHRRNGYSLILLDIEMPGMDGFRVMEDLKAIETESYVPVLALTAHPDYKLQALQSGAKDFICKPFVLVEVLMRVHNLIEVRLLHDAARHHSMALEALALNDPLTGLANRRLLAERMSMVLAHASRKKRPMAVIYLDLDGFKLVNDTFGHGVGDSLLVMVAERLRGIMRKEDTLARIGGDEFIILLSEIITDDCAVIVASKAISVISHTYEIFNQAVGITASAGIAIFPTHGNDADSLMASADAALYQAKRNGKNIHKLSKIIETTLGSNSEQRPTRECISSNGAQRV